MIKLAVTGTGKLVQEILPVLTKLTEIEVAVLCGTKRSENMVQKLCKEYEIPMGFTDYTKMLDSEELKDIDAVYLAVPNDLHYSMAKEALGDKLTGNIVKEIYVPGKIVNIVAK